MSLDGADQHGIEDVWLRRVGKAHTCGSHGARFNCMKYLQPRLLRDACDFNEQFNVNLKECGHKANVGKAPAVNMDANLFGAMTKEIDNISAQLSELCLRQCANVFKGMRL